MTRVLVAEDDADIRDLVAFKLGQAGYAIEAFADGASAWEAFERNPPQLAVLDVMMPGLSGLDVLRRIRDSAHASVPVLLLSAKSRDTDVDTGFAVGADDYVIKPFSARELLHRVNGMLARSR
ncbi:MAG TPA: response regulator [Intrasporangium sp.]|uniref:response regulator transcription factor n=1 Tax=Intrasporangium sp. TaxID=1925024 RepID=UPI002D78D167|nr:response regulator [Intrasporangium sp.]HET7399546.1 response regulator [Intrasporangium sp.]